MPFDLSTIFCAVTLNPSSLVEERCSCSAEIKVRRGGENRDSRNLPADWKGPTISVIFRSLRTCHITLHYVLCAREITDSCIFSTSEIFFSRHSILHPSGSVMSTYNLTSSHRCLRGCRLRLMVRGLDAPRPSTPIFAGYPPDCRQTGFSRCHSSVLENEDEIEMNSY